MIDNDFIPGGTVMSVPTYTIQRDPRFWTDAHDFIPERWGDLSTEKAPWIPFTRGQWACPGRNFAMMELRMVISRIALQYNIAIAEEDLGERFDKEAKDTFTLTLPPLRLVFSSK
jgi:cytochrome P450